MFINIRGLSSVEWSTKVCSRLDNFKCFEYMLDK